MSGFDKQGDIKSGGKIVNKSKRRCAICKSKNGYVLSSGLFVCRACGERTPNHGAFHEPVKHEDKNELIDLLDNTIEKNDKGIE